MTASDVVTSHHEFNCSRDGDRGTAPRRALRWDELERHPHSELAASPSQFSGVAAAASNDVWAVGSKTVSATSNTLIEHWDGTSWSVVPSPTPSGGGLLLAVTAISTTDVWAVGIQSQFSGDVVEHWDGTSWSLVSSPAFTGASDILRGIAAVSAKSIFAVGSAIEHWNGHKWSLLTTPSGVSGMDGVTALSDGTVVIVTSGGAIIEN
jgi:hypothetical protein